MGTMPQSPRSTLSTVSQTLDFLSGPVFGALSLRRGWFGEDFKQST